MKISVNLYYVYALCNAVSNIKKYEQLKINKHILNNYIQNISDIFTEKVSVNKTFIKL